MKSKIKSIVVAILCTILYVTLQMGTMMLCSKLVSMSFVSQGMAKEVVQKEVIKIVMERFVIISIIACILFLILMLAILKIRKKDFIKTCHFKIVPIQQFILPFLLAFFYSSAFNILRNIAPISDKLMGKMGKAISLNTPANFIWYVVAIFISAPVVEEIAFRGLIMSRLRSTMSATTSIITSALLFALIHIMTGSVLVVGFAFVGGLLFGLSYEKTGSLYPAIVAHLGGNIGGLMKDVTGGLPSLIQYILFGVSLLIAILTCISLIKKPSAFKNIM